MRGARILALGATVATVHCCAAMVQAGGHTWRINEVFSSADGSVQFIELIETCGGAGEISMTQVSASGGTVDILNLSAGSSSNKRILLGTSNLQSFGGPAPDYIIPANFFSLTGDSIVYQTYHTNCTFPSGTIPTDGTSSLNRSAACGGSGCPATVAMNSPTNFAGQSSPVTAPGCADNDTDGYGDPGDASCSGGPETDCDDGNAAINPAATEDCLDEIDNDCDGLIDCDDPECLNEITGLHCIPAASAWGLLCLTLLLATAASLGLRHAQQQTPT